MATATSTPSTATHRVTLRRNGRNHTIRKNEVTGDVLRRLFQVDPSDVWLVDDLDSATFFPMEDGTFNLQDVSQYAVLVVEGASHSGHTVTSTPLHTPPLFSRGPRPVFRSVVNTAKRSPTCSLKIVKANMKKDNRRPTFDTISLTYVEVSEESANLEYITSVIHTRWGSEFTLVSNDGLPLEDSPTTQGLGFWKVPSRKLYAVCLKDTHKRTMMRSDSDDEFEPHKKESKLNLLMTQFGSLKDSINSMMELNEDTRIPLGLKVALQGAFKCKICLVTPIKPPVIIATCCKVILGCETCVNSWYSGEDALTKTCPSCRGERGYNTTMLLRGLDDFLGQICKVMKDHDENF